MSYEFYDDDYDYEGDDFVRDNFPFFPKKMNYDQILCFLVRHFMDDECDYDYHILHASKTYQFIVSCYSYCVKKGGLTEKQGEAIHEIYMKYRRKAIECLISQYDKPLLKQENGTIQ